jgi:hypothetical protein
MDEACCSAIRRMGFCSCLSSTSPPARNAISHSPRPTNTIPSGHRMANGPSIPPTVEATHKFGGAPRLGVKNSA